MGRLHDLDSGALHELEARHSIGRSSASDLRLSSGGVSGAQAVVHWTGEQWMLRDLSSVNGTTVDGTILRPGIDVPLRLGMQIRFGDLSTAWRIDSEEPPLDERRATETTRPALASSVHVRDIEMEFRVSSDEERVDIGVRIAGRLESLGVRSHHYTLLVLARQRIEDAEDPDLLPDEQGWLYTEGLADMLRADPNLVNVHIHRGRKQFLGLGISDPEHLVERRSDTGQLRLGVARVVVHAMADRG